MGTHDETGIVLIGNLHVCPLRPLSQADVKSVTADLKSMGREYPSIATVLTDGGVVRDFIVSALSLSPYLRDLVQVQPSLLVSLLENSISQRLQAVITEAREAWRGDDGAASSDAIVMSRLRIAKRQVSFLTAMADLARLFDARETTRWLSEFATAAVSAAMDHLLLSAHQDGKVALPNVSAPSESSGVAVLGMGKLGACELNYSSDIDLVVFFDPQAQIVVKPDDTSEVFARLLRRLIRIMQERTAEGYVFRTDLRLRPDPGSTPLAISVDAAMLYYESRGQNWERAAYIKARPVGGDLRAGEAFLAGLRPFVFRKYLDYAAIADIHSIKRQIHAHKGHGEIAVKGHNVKLGRGGIREIEFFVQTQQLIAGGRMPELRLRETEPMLKALATAQWIDSQTAAELTDAYWFLRDVEHRIQMVRDEQTHLLPDTEAELKRIAYMLGFADTVAFSKRLVGVLKTVEHRYAQLFEQEAGLSTETGNLVFTGQGDDPETLETLAGMGFQRPADMANIIRTWHYGRYRATQSVEARERLTELTPHLLQAFGQSKRADDALLRFDGFLSGLPAGIQLFSLLSNNPGLLSLLVSIMSSAPRLADIIAARPHVFDGMLDPGLLAELPTRAYLSDRIAGFVSGGRHYEEILDRLRIIASEQRFLIGIRLLTGSISGEQAARAFTHVADLILEATLKAVRAEIAHTHGQFPGGAIAIVGMGKLGSFELTAGSDLDLILLYDYDDEAAESDGPKPLDAVRYFTRVTQRLMAALSAPTAEGVLYEVDMRLRPSGNKGPVATRISAFAKYQLQEAWTWEHMALTRARVVCGDAQLVNESSDVFDTVLTRTPDVAKITSDVAEMRSLIEAEKPAKSVWDFKLIAGGLIDIEFIAQYLTLLSPKSARGGTTGEVLKRVGPQRIRPDDLEKLLTTLTLMTNVSQIIRLCMDGAFDPALAPAGLIDLVCRAGDAPDIKVLEADIRARAKVVRRIFQSVVTS